MKMSYKSILTDSMKKIPTSMSAQRAHRSEQCNPPQFLVLSCEHTHVKFVSQNLKFKHI